MTNEERRPGAVENVTLHEELDDVEKRELGEKLARLSLDISACEEEKADTAAAFNAKIKTMNRQHHDGSQVLDRGFRILERRAIVEINLEEKKRYYRDPDTGAIIKQEDLKPGDQPDLQF